MLTTSPTSCAECHEFGSLNLMELFGAHRACYGTALPYCFCLRASTHYFYSSTFFVYAGNILNLCIPPMICGAHNSSNAVTNSKEGDIWSYDWWWVFTLRSSVGTDVSIEPCPLHLLPSIWKQRVITYKISICNITEDWPIGLTVRDLKICRL